MNTKSKSIEIARNFVTLRDQGLSAANAIATIAEASHTDSDTILVAIHYALAA